MEEFYLKVYLFKPNRLPPIKIAKDSQLKITIETMDYTIPPGATASAFANGVTSEKVYTQSCTVSGNKVSFTPVPGFFVQGRNLLQYEIGGGVIPLAIDVNCEISLPTTGETAEPETVRPLVQRAESAAATAEEKANAAAGSAQAAQDYLQKTQEISVNPAYIGDNGNWYVWSAAAGAYVDSGVKAQGPKGEPGAVQTVCGVAPDASGNVALNAGNVGALPLSGGTMTGPINMNGQPISGLIDPTEDTQAARKGYVDTAVRKAAPWNLLDNSDFRNPVEQAGRNGLHGTAKYAIDRWLCEPGADASGAPGSDLVLVSDKTNWVTGITQNVDTKLFSRNKVYTFAVYGYINNACRLMVYNGDDSFGVKYFGGNAAWETYTMTFTVPDTFTGDYVRFMISTDTDITGNAAYLRWSALYEGSYTAETLPEYRPKGYGAELVECQRYYQIRSANNIAAVDMRPTMRLSSPTITSVTGGYAYSADL